MPEQLPIVLLGNEILKKKTRHIKKVDNKLIKLIEDMFYTMYNASGQGLAAPQIDEDIALCVLDVSHHKEYKNMKPLILINPVIEKHYGDVVVMEEGCLSIPKLGIDVERNDKIIVRYNDLAMNEQTLEADDILSRCIQHEVDHLNGKLITDVLTPAQKKELKDEIKKIKKGEIEIDYPFKVAPKK
ncbi:peptide deformylase [soil metagenome]